MEGVRCVDLRFVTLLPIYFPQAQIQLFTIVDYNNCVITTKLLYCCVLFFPLIYSGKIFVSGKLSFEKFEYE